MCGCSACEDQHTCTAFPAPNITQLTGNQDLGRHSPRSCPSFWGSVPQHATARRRAGLFQAIPHPPPKCFQVVYLRDENMSRVTASPHGGKTRLLGTKALLTCIEVRRQSDGGISGRELLRSEGKRALEFWEEA